MPDSVPGDHARVLALLQASQRRGARLLDVGTIALQTELSVATVRAILADLLTEKRVRRAEGNAERWSANVRMRS